MIPVHGFWKYHCPCGKIQRRFCDRPPIADQIPLRRACGIHICRASSFKRYAPFLIFAHKRLCAVLFIGGTKFRVNVILATRGEFGGVTLLYSARWSSPFAPNMGVVFIITRQKKKTRAESERIQNQKCGISKEFRHCRRTDRSCRDCARGSLHRPGSSGLPASGMFLRSLDRVFRDTADSLADPSGA